jgi:hypothetical protein
MHTYFARTADMLARSSRGNAELKPHDGATRLAYASSLIDTACARARTAIIATRPGFSTRDLAAPDINIGTSYAPNANSCHERALLFRSVARVACQTSLPTPPSAHCTAPRCTPYP